MRYALVPLIGISLLALASCGQSDSHLDLLLDQVDAFNNGDIDRLTENVTHDFKWFSITPDTLLIEVSGKEAFRTSMEAYFGSRGSVLSSIDSYAIDGNRISFREVVSHDGTDGKPVFSSAMGVYEMRDGLIYRAWYFIE